MLHDVQRDTEIYLTQSSTVTQRTACLAAGYVKSLPCTRERVSAVVCTRTNWKQSINHKST